MNNGRRASLAPAPAEMPETQRGLGNATVERREADVPVARDGHARKRECRAFTSATNKVLRLPALRRPLIFGAGAAADAKDSGASPSKRRQQQRRCGGDKEKRRDNPGAENAPRER